MELRLTFRNKVDVCWQKQLRDKFNSEGVPPVPHLKVGNAIVRPITREMAKQIILKYEWLGTLGGNPTRFYGIFFGSFCAGVTCWAVGGWSMPAISKMLGVGGNEISYLCRGACTHWAPKGTNSKLISVSSRMEKAHSKIAIAFSDTDAGEIGTVYQAANWTFLGGGSVWVQWVTPNGVIQNLNAMTRMAKARKLTTAVFFNKCRLAGWTTQKSNPKGRYVYILDRTDKRLIDKVEAMRQPYPKRGTGETDNAAHSHAQTGGASPTVPLLNNGS